MINLKRILSILLISLIFISLCSCKKNDLDSDDMISSAESEIESESEEINASTILTQKETETFANEDVTTISNTTELQSNNEISSTKKELKENKNSYNSLLNEFNKAWEAKKFPNDSYKYFKCAFDSYYNNYNDWYDGTLGLPNKYEYIRKYLIDSLQYIKKLNFYQEDSKQAEKLFEEGSGYGSTTSDLEINFIYSNNTIEKNSGILAHEWVGHINQRNVVFDSDFEDDTGLLRDILIEGGATFHQELFNKITNNKLSAQTTEANGYSYEYSLITGNGYHFCYNFYANLVCFAGFDTMENLMNGKISLNDVKTTMSNRYGRTITEDVFNYLEEFARLRESNDNTSATNKQLAKIEVNLQKKFIECIKQDISKLKTKEQVEKYVVFYKSYKVNYMLEIIKSVTDDTGSVNDDKTADMLDLWSVDEMLTKKCVDYNALNFSNNPTDNYNCIRCFLYNMVTTTSNGLGNYDAYIPYITEADKYYCKNGKLIYEYTDGFGRGYGVSLTYKNNTVSVVGSFI